MESNHLCRLSLSARTPLYLPLQILRLVQLAACAVGTHLNPGR